MQVNLTWLLGDPVTETGYMPFLTSWPMKALLFLQVADIATTTIFRSMGLAESNPLVDNLMERFGIISGLLLVKAVAIVIAVTSGIATRPVFVQRINCVYCVILSLNLMTILSHLRPF